MKKLLLSMLAIATLASCSKNEKSSNDGAPVAIAFSAGIEDVAAAKGAISGTKFPAMTPAFGLTAYSGTTAPTADWATSYFADEDVNSDASGAISLANVKYYPADPTENLYFYAYAPKTGAVITAGTASTAPIATYDITGQEDIMAASITTGFNKSNVPPQPNFAFTHKLKQVRFKVVADGSFETGWSVKSITIKNVKSNAALDIATGALTFDTDTKDLTLPIVAGTKDAINTTGVEMDGCVMFESGTTFTVDIVVNNGADEITFSGINVSLTSASSAVAGDAGVSHLVLLTFKQAGVAATAEISDWKDAGTTGVDVM